MNRLVTFGEVMLRLQPREHRRLVQSGELQVSYAGAEVNVAVSAANYGMSSVYVTALPDANPMAQRCINELNGLGVDTSHIVRCGERMGVLYTESGSNMRPSMVFYDRTNSSISQLDVDCIDWRKIMQDATWFHWSGITPAISQKAADNCRQAIKVANELNVCVSCDINYRAKLWNYGKSATEVMTQLLQGTDVIIGNEEDCCKVFDINPDKFDAEQTNGEIDARTFTYVCREMLKKFPRAHTIALTLRGAISAEHNTWQAVLYQAGQLYCSRRYNLTDIVDRVGAGDSFSGALIYALSSAKSAQEALEFSTAASALKHTIEGDYNCVNYDEVCKLMQGHSSGRVCR